MRRDDVASTLIRRHLAPNAHWVSFSIFSPFSIGINFKWKEFAPCSKKLLSRVYSLWQGFIGREVNSESEDSPSPSIVKWLKKTWTWIHSQEILCRIFLFVKLQFYLHSQWELTIKTYFLLNQSLCISINLSLEGLQISDKQAGRHKKYPLWKWLKTKMCMHLQWKCKF